MTFLKSIEGYEEGIYWSSLDQCREGNTTDGIQSMVHDLTMKYTSNFESINVMMKNGAVSDLGPETSCTGSTAIFDTLGNGTEIGPIQVV